MSKIRIWTENEEIIVTDSNSIKQLIKAMRFKALHIKARADPELFDAVADMLTRMDESNNT